MYVINSKTITSADWADSEWTIDVLDSSYVKPGTTITIDNSLNVAFTQGGEVYGRTQATVEDNGLLWFSVYSDQQTMTTNGAVVPAGAQVMVVLSMIQTSGSDDPDNVVDRHVTVLTLANDPQNAGVMGAEDTGTDPDGDGDYDPAS